MSPVPAQVYSAARPVPVDWLPTTGLVHLDGLTTRRSSFEFASRIMRIVPHPDSDADGLTVIHNTGRHADQAGCTGLTSAEVLPHTERSGIPTPPRLMMLVCRRPATRGGECLLADGRAVREDLAAHHPDALAALSAPRSVYFGGAGGHLGAVFGTRPDGRPEVRLRWDSLVRFSPLVQPYLPVLRAVIARHQQVRRLRPGQGYLLDNTRWLHARNAFAGPRVCYRALGEPKDRL